jgi:hypothetical protein
MLLEIGFDVIDCETIVKVQIYFIVLTLKWNPFFFHLTCSKLLFFVGTGLHLIWRYSFYKSVQSVPQESVILTVFQDDEVLNLSYVSNTYLQCFFCCKKKGSRIHILFIFY